MIYFRYTIQQQIYSVMEIGQKSCTMKSIVMAFWYYTEWYLILTVQFWEITVNNHIIVTIRNTDQSQMIPTYFYQQRDIMHAKYVSSTFFIVKDKGMELRQVLRVFYHSFKLIQGKCKFSFVLSVIPMPCPKQYQH